MNLTLSPLTPIGLDVGDRWVKAVQLARGGPARPWRAHAVARFRRREDSLNDAEAARIEAVLHRRGFTGARLILAAPPRSLLGAAITLPPASSGAPLDQIARAEMARIARKDPAAVQVGWWTVPPPAAARAGEATHALAAACPRHDVERLIAHFDAAGLEVEILDSPAWALARAAGEVLRAGGERPELCAVLDLGHALASLVVLRDGVPIYERSLEDLGVSSLEAELRGPLALTEEAAAHVIERIGAPAAGAAVAAGGGDTPRGEPDEAAAAVGEYLARVAREVAASTAYLAHRYPAWPVERLILAGGGALIPGAAQELGELVGIPAHAATIDAAADPERAVSAAHTLAAGLALHREEEAA